MALRPFLLLLLLLLAATLLITQAQGIGSSASDCCLKHSQKRIPKGVVVSYRRQKSESGCLLEAVVKSFCCSSRFTTKRKKKICASPEDISVQNLMKHLDAKGKKDGNGQAQRPRRRPKKQRPQEVSVRP